MTGIQKHKKQQKAIGSSAVKAALVDGLLSDSSTHIQMLLQTKDAQVMTDTMQQLAQSPKSIDTFLRALGDSVQKHPQSADKALGWLNKLMECHSGYIVSSPELTARLRQLRAQMQVRVANFERLLQLKGKLDLLLSLHSRPQQALTQSMVAVGNGDARVRPALYEELEESDVSEEEDEEAAERGLTGQLLGNGEASEDEASEGPDDAGNAKVPDGGSDVEEEEEAADLSELSSSEAADDDEDLEEEKLDEEDEEEDEDEE